jgi:hypothetical protein
MTPPVHPSAHEKKPPIGVVRNEAVERLPVIAYGHSWVASTLAASNRWIDRVAGRLDLTVTNRAANGSTAQDVANLIIGSGYGGAFVPGTRGIVVIECGAAEINAAGAITPVMVRSIEENLRASILAVLGGVRDEVRAPGGWVFNEDWQWAGAWAEANAEGSASASNWVYTTAQNDETHKQYTEGTYIVNLAGVDPNLGGAQVEILVGGNVVEAVDTSLATYDETGGNGKISRLITIPAGGAELRVRKADANGPFLVLDYVAPLDPHPAQVVVVREVLVGDNDNDAVNDAITAAVEGLDPAHVTVVDPRPGWNPATMIGVDGVHPNDRGTAHIANAVEAELRELPYRLGMNIL